MLEFNVIATDNDVESDTNSPSDGDLCKSCGNQFQLAWMHQLKYKGIND